MICSLFLMGPFSSQAEYQANETPRYFHLHRINKLPFSVFQLFSPKDEDHLLNGVCDPESSSLPDSLFEPVIERQVFINQETPHSLLH